MLQAPSQAGGSCAGLNYGCGSGSLSLSLKRYYSLMRIKVRVHLSSALRTAAAAQLESCDARDRLFELLKNAMRAVVEAHARAARAGGSRSAPPPPIIVRICDAPASVTLRISDQVLRGRVPSVP